MDATTRCELLIVVKNSDRGTDNRTNELFIVFLAHSWMQITRKRENANTFRLVIDAESWLAGTLWSDDWGTWLGISNRRLVLSRKKASSVVVGVTRIARVVADVVTGGRHETQLLGSTGRLAWSTLMSFDVVLGRGSGEAILLAIVGVGSSFTQRFRRPRRQSRVAQAWVPGVLRFCTCIGVGGTRGAVGERESYLPIVDAVTWFL